MYFELCPVDRLGCSLDSEHIFRVSSKYLQLYQRYYKMSKILHDDDNDDDDNDDTKAIAIPRVYFENSRARNEHSMGLLIIISRIQKQERSGI